LGWGPVKSTKQKRVEGKLRIPRDHEGKKGRSNIKFGTVEAREKKKKTFGNLVEEKITESIGGGGARGKERKEKRSREETWEKGCFFRNPNIERGGLKTVGRKFLKYVDPRGIGGPRTKKANRPNQGKLKVYR